MTISSVPQVQLQEPHAPHHVGDQRRQSRTLSIVDRTILRQATIDSFRKLEPRVQLRNPVMFTVGVGAIITTIELVRSFIPGTGLGGERFFTAAVSLWLWFTVLFANFAEAMAEGRGKAQADTLRRTRTDAQAKRLLPNGETQIVSATELRRGDLVLVEAGDLIPGDGEVLEGVASVNEAAITGESAPVIKEPGTDIRSPVTGGTTIVSDYLKIRITANPGETFIDRMIALVEGATRQKTPNEIALNILLASLTIIFLLAVYTLQPFAQYSGSLVAITTLVAFYVCLIPTTIGGLLSAIGIAGMDRLVQFNVLAMSGRAVEAAGDVDTLLLDKTGTITYGNRLAYQFVPIGSHTEAELTEAALRSSLADETPEGKSIVTLAGQQGIRVDGNALVGAELVPFTAETRMSGIRLNGDQIMKGAVDAIRHLTPNASSDLTEVADAIAREGGTPLAVAHNGEAMGVIYLKDTVKPGMRERFDELRRMGIRTIMVTGDNRLTAATIAREAGVDDFVAESKPEDKIGLIRAEQAEGKLVAMTGDGTNDAPALAQADVGMAMNSGTGIIYPLVMTGLAQVFFHDQANGSLLENAKGQIVGSSLIGQTFARPQYFHPRLSAAGKGYDATSSGGTNPGPTSRTLLENTVAQANLIRKENNLPAGYLLPADAVSTLASGLDPDISPAYADLQVPRVARGRGLSQATVLALVKKYTAGRTFGVLGEPHVEVLQLNLALDRLTK